MSDEIRILALIFISTVIIAASPFILIWCIRTLFLVDTPYGWWEWLAALMIMGLPISIFKLWRTDD